ncbi:MAG: BlaI/MecI/CopY family transcriptional regulator [Bacteroidales bacterium]|jgi:predicted transcriptional regulator|nr:BlaI/MecI/CopY family transcriptional regulator [Bacteroidales bacterium]
MLEKLSSQEEEAMFILWRLKKGVVRDVLEHYSEPKPPYTTLSSIIKKLETKKFVKSLIRGMSREYHPIVNEAEYRKQSVNSFVKNYFADSYSDVVSFFAREQTISANELREIIQLIEKQESKPRTARKNKRK